MTIPMLRCAVYYKLTDVSEVLGEPGRPVSIVSGYRVDDRLIEVRSPAEAKGFFL
jgi:uncharacterized protein YcbK (DUF882 family)